MDAEPAQAPPPASGTESSGGGKPQPGGAKTELAAERTVLANERTYSAWMRTGLAALVSGLAALRFMQEALSSGAVQAIAIGLLVFAGFSFVAGAWRYLHMGRSLKVAEIPQVNSWLVLVMSALLVAAALIAIAGALLLR